MSILDMRGLMCMTMDRKHPIYKGIYCQRTSAERINSQAKDLGIERPKVRNGQSVRNLNTLIYIVINLKVLRHPPAQPIVAYSTRSSEQHPKPPSTVLPKRSI